MGVRGECSVGVQGECRWVYEGVWCGCMRGV